MRRLLRGIATRTDRVPAVGAGWIEVQSRRITGRVLEVTVHPDGYPPTRLTCVGWPTVHHLQLSGDPERLHSEARVAMHMPVLSRLLADFRCPP